MVFFIPKANICLKNLYIVQLNIDNHKKTYKPFY